MIPDGFNMKRVNYNKNLSYKTIFRYTLREYEDQPSWDVHIRDNTNNPIDVQDVGTIELIKRTDFNFKELTLLYYKKREGVYGESYAYFGEEQAFIKIRLENNDTHRIYTLREYEEHIKEGE